MTIDPVPHSRCTLDVAIATHTPEGIQRVASMDLPVIDGVSYIVSWQDHRDAPIPQQLTERDDVTILRFDGKGLSRNRNNALSHCNSDVILISDDDTRLYTDGIYRLIDTFTADPDLDLATLRADYAGTHKYYPSGNCRLRLPLPKNYFVSSIEIAFRRNSTGNPEFHPDFGIGSDHMHGGEDELLLLSAIRRGLNCQYIPLTICSHPQESTGTKPILSGKNIRAMGCIIALTYPVSCILRLPLKAWRIHRRGQSSLPKALLYLASGALRAPFLFPDKKYLW